jgi:hypothetical protein
VSDLLALVAGTVLAVGALGFVLYPLFFPVGQRVARSTGEPAVTRDASAIQALREIEFDRATGKLSESDYQELRRTYTEQALREMRAADAGTGAPAPDSGTDPVEARVLAYRMARRECPTCGLRPEPDALYCSNCARYLAGACPHCFAPVPEMSAAFCSTCGATLANVTPSAPAAPAGRAGATI